MKYYVYVSDTKLEMLYNQIPKPLRKKLATELKIDLKFLSTTFSKPPSEENKFSKLRIVVDYIKKHEKVGTVDQPANYFEGRMALRWGPLYSRFSGAVYFGGVTRYTILGLAGSSRHIIGEIGSSTASPQSMSLPSPLLHLLASDKRPELSPNVSRPSTNVENQQALFDVAYATKTMQGLTQELEFLAKRLLDSECPAEIRGMFGFSEKRVLLGTPIYVALVD